MIKVTVDKYNSFNNEHYGNKTFFIKISTDKFIEKLNLTYGDRIDVEHDNYLRINKDDYTIINIELEEVKTSFFSDLVNDLGIFEERD